MLNYFQVHTFYYQKATNTTNTTYIPYTTQKKPEWVKDEVIRIKAIDPHISSRTLALVFNTAHNNASVGKTFVDYTLRNYAYEVQVLRKELKNKPAHKVLFNNTWGIDLTFVNEVPILGVIEHHSRKVLELIPLQQKSSVNILFALLVVFKKYPTPKFIRSDNESCFTSWLMKFAFLVLGIKHQKIDKGMPWQNGRIERFFGTLKSNLALLPKVDNKDLYYLSHSFSFWYNHIRPHQNLAYKTPATVYDKRINEIYHYRRLTDE